MKTIKTPCIGICSTVFGDEVCRGCKRFVHEVIDWNTYSSEQKLLVKDRLDRFTTQVLTGKLQIIDAELFKESLHIAEVDKQQSEAMQIISLLRKASKQMKVLKEHGLQALPEYAMYSANELKELIEAEIHVLSTATYQKNFKRAQVIQQQNSLSSERKASALESRKLFNDANNENEVQLR